MKTFRTKVGEFLTQNAVARQVNAILGAYNQWYENRERDKEIVELLATVPGKDEVKLSRNKLVFETLLRNTQSQFDSAQTYSYTQKKAKDHRRERKQFLGIVRKALGNLHELFDLVGVQPMKGPVSMVYALQFRSHEDGKLSLDVVSKAVEAYTRKLQAGWTLEASQDLKSMHGISVEDEIESILASEVSHEISNEVVSDLVALAQKSKSYDFTSDVDQYGISLAINLNRAANDIAFHTRRGAGNYIVTSPMGIAELHTLMKGSVTFKAVENPSHSTVFHAGDICVGKGILYRVYCSAFGLSSLETKDEVCYLVGYKGTNGECDTGYFFTPYMPMLNMGIVVDAHTFQPMQRFATRHGKHVVENGSDYYRLVKGTISKPAVAPVTPTILNETASAA